jgi:hypothetical protein
METGQLSYTAEIWKGRGSSGPLLGPSLRLIRSDRKEVATCPGSGRPTGSDIFNWTEVLLAVVQCFSLR